MLIYLLIFRNYKYWKNYNKCFYENSGSSGFV